MKYHIITYDGSKLGESGEPCGTKYIFDSACDACGTGAELKDKLKVKGISKTKKHFFATLDGDYIISKKLYDRIIQEGQSLELSQVVDSKNQLLDYYHFYSRFTLPKFKSISTGFVTEDQCAACQRNGYYNEVNIGAQTILKPLNLMYDDKDLENIIDLSILKTWECTGLSNKVNIGNRVIGYARPWIVVREDLKNIFDKLKIKNLQYEEIKIAYTNTFSVLKHALV